MVEIFKSQKHVFWQALVLTLVVFNIGVYLGYSLEASRIKKIDKLYVKSELELLDTRILNEAMSISEIECGKAIEENIKFADRIYEESKLLERYGDASRISEDIIFEHKKYDLLRVFFWINSIKLKKKCMADYHNLVYIYEYDEKSLELQAKQKIFSNFLGELKQKYGNKILLIPFAGNLNLSSVELMKLSYGVEKLPVIIVDEKYLIYEIEELEEIEKYLS